MQKYSRLCIEERREIFRLKGMGIGVREIGRRIGRNSSIVSREIRRNADELGYLPDTANKKFLDRRSHRKKKIVNNSNIRDYVIQKLKSHWSPEQISGSMRVNRMPIYISQESIYQFVYSAEGKDLGLYFYLRYRQQKRNQIYGRRYRSSTIKDRVSIQQRPDDINKRLVVGDLEGDLTFFYGSRSHNLTVLTDRKSRYTMLIKNESKNAHVVIDGITRKIAGLSIRSITFDNGTEFAYHKQLLERSSISTYFCDPGAPWQKGSVENSISRLHRFIDKKQNIQLWSDAEIERVERQLNSTPRKVLGYLTPFMVFSGQN